MKPRKVDPDRFPPCPACGVRYADWRGEYAAALAWVARRGLGERVERVGGVS